MASRARKTPTPRTWARETAYTLRICARIPLELASRMKLYTETFSATNTEVIIQALDEFLEKRGA